MRDSEKREHLYRTRIRRFLAVRVPQSGTSEAGSSDSEPAQSFDAALENLWSELGDVPDSVRYRDLLPELASRLEQERSFHLWWWSPGLGRIAAAGLLLIGALGGFYFGATHAESRGPSSARQEMARRDDPAEWLDLPSSTFAEEIFQSWQIESGKTESGKIESGPNDPEQFEDEAIDANGPGERTPGLPAAETGRSGSEGRDA